MFKLLTCIVVNIASPEDSRLQTEHPPPPQALQSLTRYVWRWDVRCSIVFSNEEGGAQDGAQYEAPEELAGGRWYPVTQGDLMMLLEQSQPSSAISWKRPLLQMAG